jgi:N-acyl homoserine lactone hydrolase
MKMYAFHCGGERARRSLFDPLDSHPGATIELPYFCYLIRHPDGDVLFARKCGSGGCLASCGAPTR